MKIYQKIRSALQNQILVLDGAMGTSIQTLNLTESDYRGGLFSDHPPQKGNIDILNLTKPEVIKAIHLSFLKAGANIIETNTFNANRISQAEYQTDSMVLDINLRAAVLAREAVEEFSISDDSPLFVAGAVGPTGKSLSLSQEISGNPNANLTFDSMVEVYIEQIAALLEGGVDIILLETVFDTLNCKAAIIAYQNVVKDLKDPPPVMISATVADKIGRTLSGQTLEAFWISISHTPNLISVGVNCGFGAGGLRAVVGELSRVATCAVCIYPNAGIPDELGRYNENPDVFKSVMENFLRDGTVNIIGGCCGTTPSHIRKISEIAQNYAPRKYLSRKPGLHVCGLEPLCITPLTNFVNIGERTNINGSKKFATLIQNQKWEEAVSVAREQLRSGAQILDINVDDPLLNSKEAMRTFLRHMASDYEVSKVPVMIDSSDWGVIEEGIRVVQGKPIINSLSLKDGEKIFKERARYVQSFGAAIVVMAFDEKGQATTSERRIEIFTRAYDILINELKFVSEDIIFDPNILAIGTGIKEHNNSAVSFLETISWIKSNLVGAKVIGGISNLSFSFRGNSLIRQAIHTVFLYHAVRAGLDMGIVDAGNLGIYDDLDPILRNLAEDLVLNKTPDATERMVQFAASNKDKVPNKSVNKELWRFGTLEERLQHSLIHGITTYITEDIKEAIQNKHSPLEIIEGPLMRGMSEVGKLFSEGKMFLPQVIRSAHVMKEVVSVLAPLIERKEKKLLRKRKILLATVKGDVHDIGKNIVSIVLECNGYEVVDLGVMVPSQEIVSAVKQNKADLVGLSGLITPSLEEMVEVVKALSREEITVPVLIGGATTSKKHTALKIAPYSDAPVIYVSDASQAVGAVRKLLDDRDCEEYSRQIEGGYKKIRAEHENKNLLRAICPLEEARKRKFDFDWSSYTPPTPVVPGITEFLDVPLETLVEFIDWSSFFLAWDMKGGYPDILSSPTYGEEARRLLVDAKNFLKRFADDNLIVSKAVVGLFPASSEGDDILVFDDSRTKIRERLCFLRQQTFRTAGQSYKSLADFIAPVETKIKDNIGLFAVGIFPSSVDIENKFLGLIKNYESVMYKLLSDRLAEALAEVVHGIVRRETWGYDPQESLSFKDLLKEQFKGIRPAPGYPACPDHAEKKKIFDLLQVGTRIGATLTENCAIVPQASECGYYFSHPSSRYFGIGSIGQDQVKDYAIRKGMSMEEAEKWLANNLRNL